MWHLTLLAVGLTLLAAGSSQGATEIAISLQRVDSPWGVSQLDSLLVREFNRDQRLTASIVPAGSYDRLQVGSNEENKEADYQVEILLTDQRMERRKNFNLPLIFHKYELIGVMSGELRVTDLRSGRQLLSEPIRLERRGGRIFQGSPDDDKHDPDLHLTPLRQLLFYRDCEMLLARELAEKIRPMIRKR